MNFHYDKKDESFTPKISIHGIPTMCVLEEKSVEIFFFFCPCWDIASVEIHLWAQSRWMLGVHTCLNSWLYQLNIEYMKAFFMNFFSKKLSISPFVALQTEVGLTPNLIRYVSDNKNIPNPYIIFMALSSLTESPVLCSPASVFTVGGGDTCELFVKLSITEPILGDGTWAALYLPISRDIYPYMYLVMSSQIQWVSKSNGGPVFCQHNGIAPVWPGKVCRGYNTTSWPMTTLLLLCQERSILSDPNSATGLIYVFVNS